MSGSNRDVNGHANEIDNHANGTDSHANEIDSHANEIDSHTNETAGHANEPDCHDVDAERVRDRLREIVDPCSAATGSNLNIVEMGLVKSIDVGGGYVEIEMRLTTPMCHMIPYFAEEADERVGAMDGIESVNLETDDGFEWSEELLSAEAKRKRRAVLDEHASRYQQERTTETAASDV